MAEHVEKTFHWGYAGNICVCVHGAKPPYEHEWTAFVDDLAGKTEGLKGVLVYTGGGGPNSMQRKYLAEMWSRRGAMLPVALLTPSTVVRGMVTALNWVLPKPIRTFPPEQTEEALRYLQLDDAETRAVLAKFAEYRGALGISLQADRRAG